MITNLTYSSAVAPIMEKAYLWMLVDPIIQSMQKGDHLDLRWYSDQVDALKDI